MRVVFLPGFVRLREMFQFPVIHVLLPCLAFEPKV
jgi:hypothetical protein